MVIGITFISWKLPNYPSCKTIAKFLLLQRMREVNRMHQSVDRLVLPPSLLTLGDRIWMI